MAASRAIKARRRGLRGRKTDSICVSQSLLCESIVSELIEYFRDPAVSGVVLSQYQARYIANEIVARVSRDVLAASEVLTGK